VVGKILTCYSDQSSWSGSCSWWDASTSEHLVQFYILSFPHYSRHNGYLHREEVKRKLKCAHSKYRKYVLIFPMISNCRMIYDYI